MEILQATESTWKLRENQGIRTIFQFTTGLLTDYSVSVIDLMALTHES